MKIVIAPDSFKESLSASEVADAIEAGFVNVFPDAEIFKLPVADGGEGSTDALISATQGHYFSTSVMGPMGEAIDASWGMLGNSQTAVVEVAKACGLSLVPLENRNPMIATSYGLGELILAAVDNGANHIIVGLGGSACNDGGAGMLQALGVHLLDFSGNQLNRGVGSLSSLSSIDSSEIDSRLQGIRFEVACDVDNPLLGPQGASVIFAPQKGADSEMIAQLDANLTHYSDIITSTIKKDVSEVPGSGAAGGIGSAFLAFLNAELKSGINIILDAIDFEHQIKGADLVITGEGRFDSQSIRGKAPIGVAKSAKRNRSLVFMIAGSVEDDERLIHKNDIDRVFSVVSKGLTLEKALANPSESITLTSIGAAKYFRDHH